MAIIKTLSKELIEKIAAGEVVERPASVVKELIENAIDAHATSITLDVCEGGKKKIIIIDNGHGMDVADLKLSVQRHATSKISTGDDLWNISTMGFRGEALAAIGAVSKLAIESKVNQADIIEGFKINVDGGNVLEPEVCGCPGGTRIIVSDLFYNVPARQKFMRSANVEYGHICEAVMTMALSFPDIRFELLSDEKRKYFFNSGDLKERVVSVLGNKFENRLLSVSESNEHLMVDGFVAEGGRSGGKDIHVFLNKRPVRDRVLIHAVTTAFGERLTRGEYPACVLNLTIDAKEVDVNVHPAKREVRFANGNAVHDFVMMAVKKSLSGHSRGVLQYAPTSAWNHSVGANNYSPLRNDILNFNNVGARRAVPLPSPVPNFHFRPIGQLASTYILCEDTDGTLVLIDQHAAHERLGFDNLMKQYKQGSVNQQQLLIPENINLGDKGLAYVMENIGLLSKAGFEIEPFGGNTILVKSVPEILGNISTAKIFDELATNFEEHLGNETIEKEVEKIFAVVACHAQVRSGDRLSNEELTALVKDVERENITNCPHGRPALVRIEKNEIEKLFKRT